MRPKFFYRLPRRVVLLAVSWPWTTLIATLAICINCILLGVFRLPISTDQNKLFSRDVPFFKNFLDFEEKFPENEAAYVLIEAVDPQHVPPTDRWTAAANAVAGRLRALPEAVQSVSSRVPTEKLGDQGLLFEAPADVPRRYDELSPFLPLAHLWGEKNDTPPAERFIAALRAKRLFGGLGAKQGDDDVAPFVTAVARSWTQALANPKAPLRPGDGLPNLEALGSQSPRELGYFFVPDETDRSRNLLLIQVHPRQDFTSLTFVSKTVEAIRAATDDVAKGFPEFHFGVTGRPALDADEMRTSDDDSTLAEILATSAVFLGLLVMLRSLRLAIAAVVCLGMGIALTFGWAWYSVGELNLLSLVFFIALIGIGMDYFVQLLSRYRVEVIRRGGPRSTWIAVSRQVAAPVITSCLGAAGAFLASYFTPFQGAADLGVIAGGGLLLCLLCGFTVLPALLTIFPPRRGGGNEDGRLTFIFRNRGGARRAECRTPRHPEGGWMANSSASPNRQRLGHRRWLVAPVIYLAVLIGLSPFALRGTFDSGLLNLQAPNLESVRLVNKLQTWSAVVLSRDLATLRRAREALAHSPQVASTESALDAQDNLQWLQSNAGAVRALEWKEPAPIQSANLPRLAAAVRSLADLFRGPVPATSPSRQRPLPPGDAAAALSACADALETAVATGRGEEAAARLSAWQAAFVGELRSLLSPFTPNDLKIAEAPDELRTHLVSADGTYALYIYPKNDLWQQQNLIEFVDDIEARLAQAPGVPPPTGIAVNIRHSTSDIQDSFLHATVYSLCLILLLVYIDLRRPRQTLLAVSVLALGLTMLLGIMRLLGVSWNMANFFGLPVLIGAGHEYGVFMVHRYREAAHDPKRRAWNGWDASDWALLLCAYVTSSSFGFFWLVAHHRGLKSLGLVMALGTACIYLAAIAVVRPVLKWRLMRSTIRKDDSGASGEGSGSSRVRSDAGV